MSAFRFTGLLLGSALLVTGCGGRADEADTETPAQADTQATGEMADMPGMSGMQGRMDEMMAHMQAMQGASADSMRAMLPMHRQMLGNMIAQMNSQMRGMNMTADAQWNATVDSLRQDLTRMPEMSAQELHAFMPEHHDRVMRVMQKHRTMMRM